MSKIILAGTGHRPDKLGGYSEEVNKRVYNLAIEELQRLKPSRVIIGMALGWDQALGHASASLGFPFDAYIPFEGQERMWPAESQSRFHAILKHAATVKLVTEGGYAAWKMQFRNEAMVNACTHVLALWDGSSGGTANCVKYAKRMAKPVINCWERFK